MADETAQAAQQEKQGTEGTEPEQQQDQSTQQEASQAEQAADQAKPLYPAWFQRRIDQLSAERSEARRENEALKQQLDVVLSRLTQTTAAQPAADAQDAAPAQAKPVAAAPVKPALIDADIDRLVAERAAQLSKVKSLDEACNKVYETGAEEFPDFEDKLGTFKLLGGVQPHFLEMMTALPNAHKVLYELGKDPDNAERVMRMEPARAAIELAKLDAKLGAPASRAVSRAPAPIKPVDATSRAESDPENMSMSEFVKWREAKDKARRGR
jgi:hypothetical protein